MAADCRNYPNTGSTPLRVQLTDALKNTIQADVGHSAYIHLSGRYMRGSQLGGDLHRFFKLRGFVEVREHAKNWYSAKFSCQWDYDQAFRASSWRIFGRYSIQVYTWEPNFQFGEEVPPPLHAGDIVEGRVEGLGLEYRRDEVLIVIANAVCAPVFCRAFMVDTSLEGKLPRFFFEYNGAHLPSQIQIDEAPVLGLSYSRAQQCYNCLRFGHIKRTCPVLNPEPRQWKRSLNRDDPFSSGSGRILVHQRRNVDSESALISDSRDLSSDLPPPALFPDGTGAGLQRGSHRRHRTRSLNRDGPSRSGSGRIEVHHRLNVDSESAPISDSRDFSSDLPPPASLPDGTRAGLQTGSYQGTLEQTSPPEHHEETNTVAPIHVLNGIPSSSRTTCPLRTIVELKMPAKGAMFFENGGESRPRMYILEKEVSEIGVTAEVRGNLQQVTIIPRIGDAPNCTKRVIFTSIDGADATRTLEDMCHNKGASLVVVFYKSSVLVSHDQIVRRLGFSAFHCAKMTFPRVGANGSALNVKDSCLLMWKKEEVRVEVSAVNMESSFQHLKFSASWVIAESNEEEPDGLSHGGPAWAVEGPSDSSDFTAFDSGQESDSKGSSSPSTSVLKGSSNYSDSTAPGSSDESGPEGSSSYPTAPKELPIESGHFSPIRTPDGDTLSSDYRDASSLLFTFGEARSYETSTSSDPTSESSYSTRAVYDESPPCSPDGGNLPSDYGDADAEGSFGDEMSDLSDWEGSSGDEMSDESHWEEHFTAAEEISPGSSAPTSPNSICESDLEGSSADSTTSGPADYTFFPRDEGDTDSEGSTSYHSAAEELSDEQSSDNSSAAEELSHESSDSSSSSSDYSNFVTRWRHRFWRKFI